MNDLMPQTLSKIPSGSAAWIIFSLCAVDVWAGQTVFNMDGARRTLGYAEEHAAPVQLPSRSLTVLAQADRRVPGFEVVQVAKPQTRTPVEMPLQPAEKPSTLKASVTVVLPPSPSVVETEMVQPASRIPTMVMPSIQPAAVGSAPFMQPKERATVTSAEAVLFDAAAKSAGPDSIPAAKQRVEFQPSVGTKTFAGIWYKGSPADCHNRTDDPNYVPLRFTSNSLKFYEIKCSIRSTVLKGNTYSLYTDYVSEGEASSSTTTINMLNADSFTIDAYEPANIRGWTYHRCGSKPKKYAAVQSTAIPSGDVIPYIEVSEKWCTETILRLSCMGEIYPNANSL